MTTTSQDALYSRVARKVLKETLGMKKGEALTVETWNNGFEFAKRVVAEARAMGCTAIMIFEDEGAYVDGVRRSPKDAIGLMGKNEYNLLAGTECYVFIPGQALGAYSRTLSTEEREESTRYNDSWYEAAEKAKLRGARLTFGYIGKDLARMLGKSIDEAVEGQLKAALTDFTPIAKEAASLSSAMIDGATVTMESKGTSLRFSLKGGSEVQDGLVDAKDVETGNNMAYVPPGYVYKEVDTASAEGTVRISPTLTKFGILKPTELTFRDGRLVDWKSEDKAKLLKLMGPIPEEKRRLTFLGVGVNPALKFGLAQDRFVSGAVSFGGLGFTAIVRSASLSVGGSSMVSQGKLKS